VFQNITVVGDDAQSIYAFRGATIDNILNFEKDFPDLKVYKLEQNYRSTQNIVKAANELIHRNKNQIKKEIWTQNDKGEDIKIVRTPSDNEEGRWVADTIHELKCASIIRTTTSLFFTAPMRNRGHLRKRFAD
jgi:DNA helicase-2/ATP-dependent DNA helicase PcrA